MVVLPIGIPKAGKKPVKKLESDEPRVMKAAAREMGMSHTTAHRLANKFGKKRKAVSVIHLSPEDRKKTARRGAALL